jgi:LAGLIDADG endonuclease
MIDLTAIPDSIGYYMAGFTDGEGSFNISFRPRPEFKASWKVSACFNVSQKDKVILALFKKHLQCGTLRGRPDGVWYFEVDNLTSLTENVIPFFRKYHFLSAKKKSDFAMFQQAIVLIRQDHHLTKEGILKILTIRNKMNGAGKRKFTDEEIMRTLKESSETTRQIPVIIDSGNDIVRSL